MNNIKYINDNVYYRNSEINQPAVVYSDISKVAVHDTARLHSLKFCLSGIEIYRINGQDKVLKPGQFILVNPEQSFKITADKKNTKGICLFFNQNQDQYKEIIFENKVYNIEDFKFISNNIDYLNKKYLKKYKDGINDNEIHKVLEQIVSNNNIHRFEKQTLDMKNEDIKTDISYRLFRAKDYIDNNLYKSLTIEDIAGEAFLSKFHFIRLFKKLFGITPYKYLLEKRLDEAVNLLCSHSVSEVAAMLNFTDRSALSNAIKRKYKKSPRDLIS